MDQIEATKTYQKTDGTQRLMELGVPVEVLVRTATDIATNKGNTDEFFPLQGPGMMGWVGGVRTFRQGLVNVGCTINNLGGFSSVISADGKYEFFIMSGSRGIGRPGSKPRSKSPRGVQTIKRVEENQLSFPMEDLLVTSPKTADDGQSKEHWCFLYHVSKTAIFSEFSKPMAVDEKGFVAEWAERIILDPITIASTIEEVGHDDAATEIDVPVKPKKSELDGVQTRKVNTGKRAAGSD